MLVREAKAVARQWVLKHGRQTPGFVGAYFAGSVNWLADDAQLPATSDLDVHLALEGVEGEGSVPKLGKFVYREVLLEVSSIAREALRSPEAVLGSPHLAGAFRTRSVIVDPTGGLTALQEVVSREYADRHWVRTRCERAASGVRDRARSLDEAAPLHDQATTAVFAAGVTTHMLLAAGLKNPTVRKRYVAVRAVLAEYGRLDFHEPLLGLLGGAALDRARVEQHLDAVAAAFDAAKRVVKTPYRFASDISDAARRIAIDGSRELIERGFHREAVFWIAATYGRCRHIFAADAPDLLPRFDPGYRELLADLGLESFRERQRRCREVEAFLPRLWEVAEEILAANREIRD
jgi:hypothetical protein